MEKILNKAIFIRQRNHQNNRVKKYQRKSRTFAKTLNLKIESCAGKGAMIDAAIQ
jgi:hypothetical protein